MKKFKFTNPELLKLIFEEYRGSEDIYLFEKRVNNFLNLINSRISEQYLFVEKTDLDWINTPVEETDKLIDSFRDIIKTRLTSIIHITAYKLNKYYSLVLEGLNEDDYYAYFPIIRAILEHTCFMYKILLESNKYLDLMNESLEDIISYIKYYGDFEDIVRIFFFGTHNTVLQSESTKNIKVEDFSARKSIEYVYNNTKYKDVLESYKYLSEMSHPSVFSTNYFLIPDVFNPMKIENMVINKNDSKNLYALNSVNGYYRNGMQFSEIVFTLTDCIELFELVYYKFIDFQMKIPDLEIFKDVEFRNNKDLKMKDFLESREYYNKLKDTIKKNKYKSQNKVDKETEKIIKKKEYEINKENDS